MMIFTSHSPNWKFPPKTSPTFFSPTSTSTTAAAPSDIMRKASPYPVFRRPPTGRTKSTTSGPWRPNAKEKASFLKENFVPLREWDQLRMVTTPDGEEWLPGIRIRYFNGHTEAMMALQIELEDGRSLIYCADLLPSSGHIGLPYVMAYDVRPLITLQEKTSLLSEAVEKNYLLYFEHDPQVECRHRPEKRKGPDRSRQNGSFETKCFSNDDRYR